MRRDITFLALGGGSLLLSFFAPAALPVNPAWLAILLCGAPRRGANRISAHWGRLSEIGGQTALFSL